MGLNLAWVMGAVSQRHGLGGLGKSVSARQEQSDGERRQEFLKREQEYIPRPEDVGLSLKGERQLECSGKVVRGVCARGVGTCLRVVSEAAL